MLKKILFIVGLIFIIFIFYGYVFNKNVHNEKITVQFASWGSESEVKILKHILNDFEIQNPNIKVDFMHIPQNYFQKIHLLFASNTAPDVIFINNQYLPIYVNAGVLENLDKYDDVFEFKNFYKKSIDAMSWKSGIYAVPRDISTLLIYYNKDLFKKYNIPYPTKDWTTQDYLKIAQKLTHLPKVFGTSFEEEPLYYLPYLTSNGFNGIPYYEKIKDNEGLRFYSNLRNKYHVAPLKHESASATMAQMFLQGKLGMHLSGRWLVPKYRQEAKFDWDVINFPNGTAGSIVPLDASGWAIAKSSQHKSQAIQLIKYLSSEESINKFAQSGLIVPARIDSANSINFLDGNKPRNSQIFLDIIETSVPTSVNINYRKVLDDLKTKTEEIFNPIN